MEFSIATIAALALAPSLIVFIAGCILALYRTVILSAAGPDASLLASPANRVTSGSSNR